MVVGRGGVRQEREVGDTNEATWKEERKPAEIETEIGGVPREREREREREAGLLATRGGNGRAGSLDREGSWM